MMIFVLFYFFLLLLDGGINFCDFGGNVVVDGWCIKCGLLFCLGLFDCLSIKDCVVFSSGFVV